MYERFTDSARRVVVLAQEEARRFNHDHIGTEHILLGLIHEGEGVAGLALESLGISLEAARGQVEEVVGRGQGQEPLPKHIPFTPRAKKVMELSLREALQLGHNYIGTEHILLGLVREGEGVAAQILVGLGADLSRVRQEVITFLASESGPDLPTSADAVLRAVSSNELTHSELMTLRDVITQVAERRNRTRAKRRWKALRRSLMDLSDEQFDELCRAVDNSQPFEVERGEEA